MEKFKLNLEQREPGKPNQLRRAGKIPATVYGPGSPSLTVQVNEREFSRLPSAAYSHIIELSGGKETGNLNAIIRHVHRKPTTDRVLNIEFYRVQADRKLTVSVPLKFVGVSPAVAAGGQLMESELEAEIECLPADIPDHIEVDLAQIVEIDQGIHFADLKVSDTIKILNPADEIIVRVVAPRVVAEEKPAAVVPTDAAPAPGAAAASADKA